MHGEADKWLENTESIKIEQNYPNKTQKLNLCWY